MTVRRTASNSYEISKDDMCQIVKVILDSSQDGYSYVKTIHDVNEIATVIKPTWWPIMTSTKLRISMAASSEGCKVTVSTCSHVLVLGDIFNFYTGYINDIFSSIESKMASFVQQGTPVDCLMRGLLNEE